MKHLAASILLLSSFCATAQNSAPGEQPDYPKDYFRNPLDIPIFLAGNFGECRPGHFHSGVDIKTLGKENQPVHAAADGYISRIKMEKGGFGHGLYITHPNGYTTLYAHLNDFAPAIQQYLKKEQYAKKHWDVDIQLTPDQFPVKKGDQIAWSGNTGASTAPHLHFEIRNTKTEHPLNPELFGLPIIDKTPPLPAEVVIYSRDVIGEGFYYSNRFTFKLSKKDKTYQLADEKVVDTDLPFSTYATQDTIILDDGLNNIGIGINVDDHMDGSDNTLAFYTAQLYLDDSLQVEIKLDDIGYDLSRYVNAYADYKIKERNNKWVQCLFKLPGNHLDQIYGYLNSKGGKLSWSDNAAHKVRIIITDDRENQSEVLFYLRVGMGRSLYDQSSAMYFFLPNRINDYNGDDMRFLLSSNTLYDRVPFTPKTTKFDSGYSDKHKVLEPYIPVQSYFDLAIKSNKTVPQLMTGKVVMMYSDGKDEDGRAAIAIDSGWYRAKVRAFGTYWLEIDTTPPTIKSEQKEGANLSKAKQITFEVKDNKTSVKKFSGYLDGKWICFEQHSDLFFYKFDEHCPKGKHQLVFTAEDESGNSREFHLTFTR